MTRTCGLSSIHGEGQGIYIGFGLIDYMRWTACTRVRFKTRLAMHTNGEQTLLTNLGNNGPNKGSEACRSSRTGFFEFAAAHLVCAAVAPIREIFEPACQLLGVSDIMARRYCSTKPSCACFDMLLVHFSCSIVFPATRACRSTRVSNGQPALLSAI